MGTKTKIAIAVLLLVNVLVLVNIERSGVSILRLSKDSYRTRLRGGEAGRTDSAALHLDTGDALARNHDAGDVSQRVAHDGKTPVHDDRRDATDSSRPAHASLLDGGATKAAAAQNNGNGEATGAVATAQEPQLETVSRVAKDAAECLQMMQSLKIVPYKSWGQAGIWEQRRWEILNCNAVTDGRVRQGPVDCSSRPSQPDDPLIAVCAGSTTRGVPYPDVEALALFRFLLPSLGQTAECRFNYVAVIGYDIGDKFFDNDAGREKTISWFEREIAQPATARGLSMKLELISVENEISKPGPVFTAATKAAYNLGAKYIYRVNDDSEMVDPWARKFVDALEGMGPPYGVVGPESLNNNILVHDFTHRLHMDIFQGQYYPASLTDWYVDDWISRVYGNQRTIRAKNCQVEHHTGAHGQRYQADTTKAGSVDGLVRSGAELIAGWAVKNGVKEAALQIHADAHDGRSATKARALELP